MKLGLKEVEIVGTEVETGVGIEAVFREVVHLAAVLVDRGADRQAAVFLEVDPAVARADLTQPPFSAASTVTATA